jgi:hypothetical protein
MYMLLLISVKYHRAIGGVAKFGDPAAQEGFVLAYTIVPVSPASAAPLFRAAPNVNLKGPRLRVYYQILLGDFA